MDELLNTLLRVIDKVGTFVRGIVKNEWCMNQFVHS